MKKKLLIGITILLCCLVTSCDNTLRCERHFIPNGYIGKVIIYFDQKNGQKQFDRNGCIVYTISDSGECFTVLTYKQGSAYPNSTYKYFEVINKDSVNQIFEFYMNDYFKDTVINKDKKYIFYHSSGYSAPNYTFVYYVDYGMNYRNHLNY